MLNAIIDKSTTSLSDIVQIKDILIKKYKTTITVTSIDGKVFVSPIECIRTHRRKTLDINLPPTYLYYLIMENIDKPVGMDLCFPSDKLDLNYTYFLSGSKQFFIKIKTDILKNINSQEYKRAFMFIYMLTDYFTYFQNNHNDSCDDGSLSFPKMYRTSLITYVHFDCYQKIREIDSLHVIADLHCDYLSSIDGFDFKKYVS